MNSININFKDVISVNFYSYKNSYSAVDISFKTADGNRAVVRYEWETEDISDIPAEVLELLSTCNVSI